MRKLRNQSLASLRSIVSLCLIELLFFQSVVYTMDTEKSHIRASVPDTYGTIKSFHTGNDDAQWIIHIQDAHCNYDAQHNIQRILQRLSQKKLLDVIYVEGSEGRIDTSPLQSYPDIPVRDIVSEYLIKNADISGVEYFGIVKNLRDVPITGSETGSLYLKNLSAMWYILDEKTKNTAAIEQLKEFIRTAKPAVLSQENREFINKKNAFHSNLLEMNDYLVYLSKKTAVLPSTHPNCSSLLELDTFQKDFDAVSLRESTNQLLTDLSKQLQRDKLAELFRANLKYKLHEMSSDEFYAYLRKSCEGSGIALSHYPGILEYEEMLNKSVAIDKGILSREIESLEDAVVEQYFITAAEKNIYVLETRVLDLENFVGLTVSRETARRISDNFNRYSLASFNGLIHTIDPEKVGELQSSIVHLQKNLAQVNTFYTLARQRDEALVKNTLENMKSNGYRYGALVTGGFHTDGIKEILSEHGINYAVVAPQITNVTDPGLYFSTIRHNKSSLESFIESALNSMADASWLAERPLGFDASRQQIKLAKAVSIALAQSADRIALRRQDQSSAAIIAELNTVLKGYDARSIKVLDFQRLDDTRFYMLEINGKEMFYYFQDTTGGGVPINDFIGEDMQAIIEKDIQLGDTLNAGVIKREIIERLGVEFEDLEHYLQTDRERDLLSQDRELQRIKNAVLDYGFLEKEFELPDLVRNLREIHGILADFQQVRTAIDDLLRQGQLNVTFEPDLVLFSLSQTVRLAYFLQSMPALDGNVSKAVDVVNLSPEYQDLFSQKGNTINRILIEPNLPVEAVLELLSPLESGSGQDVWQYRHTNGSIFQARILEQIDSETQMPVRTLRITAVIPQSVSETPMVSVPGFTADVYNRMLMSNPVTFVPSQNILTLTIQDGEYVFTLYEVGNSSTPDAILYQNKIPVDESTEKNIARTIADLKNKYQLYFQVDGMYIMSSDRIQFVEFEQPDTEILDTILPDRRVAELLAFEIEQFQSVVAASAQTDEIDDLLTIAGGAMLYEEESKILARLKQEPSVYVLRLIAGSTPNPLVLKALASAELYTSPDSKVKRNTGKDVLIQKVLGEVMKNKHTPADVLGALLRDQFFQAFLLKDPETNVGMFINHENFSEELVKPLLTVLERHAERAASGTRGQGFSVPVAVINNIKVQLIQLGRIDRNYLMEFMLQDQPLEVRLAVAKSESPHLLAQDSDETIQAAVASNTQTYLPILHNFSQLGVSKAIHLALASNPVIDRQIVQRLIEEADAEVGYNPADGTIADRKPSPLHIAVATTLANGDLINFRNNRDEITDLLKDLVIKYGHDLDAIVAQAKNPLREDLLELLIEQGQEIQVLVAQRSDIAPEAGKISPLVLKLWKIRDAEVRHELLLNPAVALSPQIYPSFIAESRKPGYENGWKTRLAIALKENLPGNLVVDLAQDSNVRVRAAIAMRSDLNKYEDLFDQLSSEDQLPYVRSKIAQNPVAPISILKRLFGDDSLRAEGLYGDDGNPLEGFDELNQDGKMFITRVEEEQYSVADMVAINPRILEERGEKNLLNRIVQTPEYLEEALKMIRKETDRAFNEYQTGEIDRAYRRLQQIDGTQYALYGTLFQLGVIAHEKNRGERAQEYFQRSRDEMNNVMGIVALEYMDKPDQYMVDNTLPPHLLHSNLAVRAVLQNFHNAQQVEPGDFSAIDEFLQFVHEPIPILPDTKIRYVTRPINRAEYFEDARTKHILALAVYALRDVLNNGFIQLPDALMVLQDLLEQIDDPDKIAENWPQLRKTFWQSIIVRSNLSEEISDDLLDNPQDQVEFYLRGGARGLIKYQEYVEFRDRILMDNVPSFIRDDVARTSWLELINLTGDMLLSEPAYFRRLTLLEQGGFYRTGDNALLVSLSLSGGFLEYGAGDINRIVRSESAHLLSKNMYHNLKKNEAVDEFQDRAAGFKFPAQLAKTEQVNEVAQTYRSHDDALIALHDLVMQLPELSDLEVRLKSFKGTNLIEDFAVRNAIEGLKNKNNDPLAKRLIGEAVFYMLRGDDALSLLDEQLAELIESIEKDKEKLTTFNWNTRAFFEGGILISTLNRPFPVLTPPLDVIVGTSAVKKMDNRVNDPHYSGEWLHYLFRMRIRELLRSGELAPDDLQRFHDTASIFLASVTRNGELFDLMNVVKRDLDNNRSANATYKLLSLTNPDQKLGLTPALVKMLDDIRVSFVSSMNINVEQLKKIAADGFLESHIPHGHELYERLNHYVNNVRNLLNSDNPIAIASHRASASVAKIIEILSRTDQTGLRREFEQVFNDIAPEKVDELSSLLNTFYEGTKELRANAAFTIPAVVNVVRTMTPESVFKPIETRQVHHAEPEKRVLREVGQILSDSLFLSGEINFSRFAELARDFYTTQYSALVEQGQQISTSGPVAQNPGLLGVLKGVLFPFLEGKGINLLKLVKSMQPARNTVQSPWYVGLFVTTMFFGVKSVALMILAYAGLIGAGALLFWGGRRLIEKFLRTAEPAGEAVPTNPLSPAPFFFGIPETSGNILPTPLQTQAIADSAGLVIDYDTLLNSASSRAGLQNMRDDLSAYLGKPTAKIILVSKLKTREQIKVELQHSFIDEDKVEILSRDDIAGVGGEVDPNFNLLDFLHRSYAGDFNQFVLLASTESTLAEDVSWSNAPKFTFDSNSFSTNPYAYFSVLTFLMGYRNLPGDVLIRSISPDNRYYEWFEEQNAEQDITLYDLVTHIRQTLDRGPSIQDINGITFGSSLSLSDALNEEPVVPRFTAPPSVLESSL